MENNEFEYNANMNSLYERLESINEKLDVVLKKQKTQMTWLQLNLSATRASFECFLDFMEKQSGVKKEELLKDFIKHFKVFHEGLRPTRR